MNSDFSFKGLTSESGGVTSEDRIIADPLGAFSVPSAVLGTFSLLILSSRQSYGVDNIIFSIL